MKLNFIKGGENMAQYTEYHPLKFWLDPASIAEIVAHIQTYLVNNPINSTTEIETIIHDYLIAHPELIGGVESVNGETGEVVLTADNISAGETVTIKDVLDSLQDQINDIVISIPSDYQQLIDDVSDLKSATGYEIEYVNVTQFATITDNYFIQDTGAISAADGWSIYTLPCSDGDLFRVTALGYYNKYYYGFYDSNDVFISGNRRTESGSGTITETVEAPNNAVKIVIVGRPSTGYPARIEKGNYTLTYVDDKIGELENILNVHPIYKTDITASATIEDDYFIQDNGVISTATGWSIYTLPVKVGDSFKVTAIAYYNKYYYAFYNDSGAFISGEKRTASGTGSETFIITAPENAVKLVLVGRPNSNVPAFIYTPTLEQSKWHGKKWVVFGDSLTEENRRTTKHYFDYISEKTGISTYNMGNGGSGYASERDINTAFYQRIGSVPTDADVITIFGSFNDLSEIGTGSGQLPLGDADDNDTTTIGGLINTTFDNLFSTFPLANVGVVTPTPWVNANPTNEPNTASQYVDLIIAVCKRRGIPCLDLFHCSQLRPWEESYRALAYSKDEGNGVHPDETGHKIIAPEFEAFLDRLLLH